MEKVLKAAALLTVGYLYGVYVVKKDVENGEVIHEDDEKYVKASKSRSFGWSYATVQWKKPQ